MVGDLSLAYENGFLAGADNQLRTPFDFIVVTLEAVHQYLRILLRPLDDVDELSSENIQYAHEMLSLFSCCL